MSSVIQDRAFRDEMVASDLLERAIEWIKQNMEPEDVFTTEQLNNWAETHDWHIEE